MENKKYFLHESSYVDKPTTIGKGTNIWHFSHIMKNCVIGENCNIGQNVVISTGVTIGNGVKIQNNVSVYTGVICEDEVFLGPSCVFTNVINPRSFIERKKEYRKTFVGKGASIGANVTVICGNKIGKYALIGAGTVVTKNVPDYGLIVGNPGKIIGYVCQCGERLHFNKNSNTDCKACGKKYVKINESIVKEDNNG